MDRRYGERLGVMAYVAGATIFLDITRMDWKRVHARHGVSSCAGRHVCRQHQTASLKRLVGDALELQVSSKAISELAVDGLMANPALLGGCRSPQREFPGHFVGPLLHPDLGIGLDRIPPRPHD